MSVCIYVCVYMYACICMHTIYTYTWVILCVEWSTQARTQVTSSDSTAGYVCMPQRFSVWMYVSISVYVCTSCDLAINDHVIIWPQYRGAKPHECVASVFSTVILTYACSYLLIRGAHILLLTLVYTHALTHILTHAYTLIRALAHISQYSTGDLKEDTQILTVAQQKAKDAREKGEISFYPFILLFTDVGTYIYVHGHTCT